MAKILIVEDNVELTELIAILLEKNNHHVGKASSGEETFLQLDLLKPQLILLDIMLGKEDGRDICKEIKKTNKGIKIILISANAKLLENYEQCEADTIIEKPFELKIILNKIGELLAPEE